MTYNFHTSCTQASFKSVCNKEHNRVICNMTYNKVPYITAKMIFYQVSFIAASHILKSMLRKCLEHAQDKCFGMNYLSFLDFTHNYERTSGIFVPCIMPSYLEACNLTHLTTFKVPVLSLKYAFSFSLILLRKHYAPSTLPLLIWMPVI